MRKRVLFFVCLSLLCLLSLVCGCRSAEMKTEHVKNEAAEETNVSVKEQGLKLIALMEEMIHTEGYTESYTANERLMEIVEEISGGDYSEPTAVYAISVPEKNLLALSGMEHLDGVSEPLREAVNKRVLGSLVSQINGRSGAERLAVSAICTLEQTFVSRELTEDVIYLYTYKDALPVAVTFLRGDSYSVSAAGVFIMDESFYGASLEEVEEYFDEIGAEVKKVQ